MTEGKILVAHNEGIYLLELQGDIRLTLCASISDYLAKIFSGEPAKEVYVDLLGAECIDSTCLGLLAKLALYTRDQLHMKTKLLCVDPCILRIFESMDIDHLFDILGLPEKPDLQPQVVDPGAPNVEVVKAQVLEAHQLLVKLNPDLMGEFADLIDSLEYLD